MSYSSFGASQTLRTAVVSATPQMIASMKKPIAKQPTQKKPEETLVKVAQAGKSLLASIRPKKAPLDVSKIQPRTIIRPVTPLKGYEASDHSWLIITASAVAAAILYFSFKRP